jgi:peptidoglycan hydrolase-like protein with peptidoglycan-binding domain
MAVGVTGTCIVSLQTWLNIFDDANLVVDGKFRPKTKRAVQQFQSEHGLTADGRVGPNTRNALRGEYQYMIENSVATPRLEKRDRHAVRA